jgi:signal transduction histidine kinase
LWPTYKAGEKKVFAALFLVWAIVEIAGLFFLFQNLIFQFENGCIICSLIWVITALLPLVCLINSRKNCAINAVFALPLILYSYLFSDFNPVTTNENTLYITVFWLTAGLVYLIIFSENGLRIWFFLLTGMLTIALQLYKYNILDESFTVYKPVIIHPMVLFLAIYALLYTMHFYFSGIINRKSDDNQWLRQSITKVFQDTDFLVAQLRAERDEAGNIVFLIVERVNNAFESMFKINLYEVQEQKADYIFNLVFKSNFDLNRYILNSQNHNKNHEYHAVALEKWFSIHVFQPNYRHFFIIFDDITKTKKKIADLEISKKRYQVLLDAIPDMFFVIDKDGNYEDMVVKESALFKIEDINIIGSSIYEVGFPESMAEYIFECIQHAIQHNTTEIIEYSMDTPNGTFMFEMRIAKLNSNSVISISRDITKRKTTEFKLEKALIKAEESDKLKSAFLANLSHEIRTPMNVITNFTRILAESDLGDEEKIELNDAISLNGKQLLNMIDNTIHLSKIESQSVEVVHKFSNINSLLRDIYNRYMVLVPDSKDVRLLLKLNVPNKDFGFETDPVILSEVLSLLVDNALKYTLKGQIIIDYEMIRNEWVKFIVSDTGIGIPADEQKFIFRRFYRVQNEINKSTSGSGLGLAIAQHYVALLNGELEFESVQGAGTKFWFAIPYKNGRGFLSIVQ